MRPTEVAGALVGLALLTSVSVAIAWGATLAIWGSACPR
jgi:hypothetical protein